MSVPKHGVICNSESWLIAPLNGQDFGLNCSFVKELVTAPESTAMPGLPGHVRGVMNLRGEVFPVVDLRTRLGMCTAKDEIEQLCRTMEQRAEDHRRWLDELESSIREKREFRLTRDPHQCAFGKWYDSFRTDNVRIAGLLEKFAGPHERIHQLACETLTMVANGQQDAALRVIEQAKGTVLSAMLRLFAEFQSVLHETYREIALILDCGQRRFAVCVDGVEAVEKLSADTFEVLAGKGVHGSGIATEVARRGSNQHPVLILSPQSIL